MKIAQHFRAFLEAYQYLTLPQLGKFEILTDNGSVNEYGDAKKIISFQPDKNQPADTALVDFVKKSLKIESAIVLADLNCFISNLRELLIQGFEVEIPGIGFLRYDAGNILRFSGKNIYKKSLHKNRRKLPTTLSSTFWL